MKYLLTELPGPVFITYLVTSTRQLMAEGIVLTSPRAPDTHPARNVCPVTAH